MTEKMDLKGGRRTTRGIGVKEGKGDKETKDVESGNEIVLSDETFQSSVLLSFSFLLEKSSSHHYFYSTSPFDLFPTSSFFPQDHPMPDKTPSSPT